MRSVNKTIMKKDAMALVTGKPVYTDDIAPPDCLIVKVLRSPHAHALVKSINTAIALRVPGIECVLTYKDVPRSRFTIAGQTYPEMSPYDRLILDQRVRFVGDAVAIVAGVDEKSVDRAMNVIKVEYEVLEPVLDFRQALDNKVVVHPEDDWKALIDSGGAVKRNLCSSSHESYGELEKVLDECDIVLDRTYHTRQYQQAMMETFRAYAYKDAYDRMTIVSSTQVPFHVRRIIANALEIPKSMVRVIKPRIGGGFGAKQTAVMEMYPAVVAQITGKPAKMVYSRQESQIASSPRHESDVRVRLGAMKNGQIRAIELSTLWNAGAFAEHSPTTVTLAGHKAIPLYGELEAFAFNYDVVYTNTLAAGAYRGYGATQGIFGLESTVNELAEKINMDPTKLRAMNMLKEGQLMPAYFNETVNSCALDRCLARAKQMINWNDKYPRRDMGNGKVRGIGVSLAMQGSCISNIDTASVTIKVNDDGFYSMAIGATDMGTGCDTILAQMAAECLECDVDDIIVSGVDTDVSPYDSGSYASSTTYITGMAVVKTCETLRKRIIAEGAKVLQCAVEDAEFDGRQVFCEKTGASISMKDIGNNAMCANNIALQATESHFSPISPPPYMAGIAEVEVDTETGKIELINFASVVDCGTVINPALARVQAEGGIVQGIGMTLFENVVFDKNGRMSNDSFMQYRLPSRVETGHIEVEFESSYEPTGPFGAKSIGEIVINTPAAAIADAVYQAVGVRAYDLPIMPEFVYNEMQKQKMKAEGKV